DVSRGARGARDGGEYRLPVVSEHHDLPNVRGGQVLKGERRAGLRAGATRDASQVTPMRRAGDEFYDCVQLRELRLMRADATRRRDGQFPTVHPNGGSQAEARLQGALGMPEG